jgi:Leucine-rich repeat (LRR) protein
MKIKNRQGKSHTCIHMILAFGLLFAVLGFSKMPAVRALGTQNANTFVNCAAQTQIPEAECDALVAFYNSTNGPNWTIHTGWLQTDTPCDWYGITCTAGTVTALDLSDNHLVGPIPTLVGNLANLTGLTLYQNQLSGSIPAELGNLGNLQVLYLGVPHALSIDPETPPTGYHSNLLSGAIPPELGNLTQLRQLVLSDNKLSGSIPPELGNLTYLDTLVLENNQLSGTIPPELGNLNLLDWLALEGNQLSGAIPPELGQLADLGILMLSNNQLSGALPPELGNLAGLFYLVLNNNQFNGPIPSELGALSRLHLLILSDNQLSGPISPELGNMTGLEWLHLESNRFGGEFPTSITNLTNLETLTFDCWISSTDPDVIDFIDTLLPGWQNRVCPVVSSITRGNPNPTELPSVRFVVTFSEPVEGVTMNDFNLYTTGVTGASITEVSGSDAVYVVTVNTGFGAGTLRLDLVDDDSIRDYEHNPLGGIGDGNGNFTSGQTFMIRNVEVTIAGYRMDPCYVPAQGSLRQSYFGMNHGPVEIQNTERDDMIASQRVLHGDSSYSEMMGLPIEQLSKQYLFPYYNNVAMDSQLRVSNVGGADTTITVYLGTDQIDSYALAAGGSTRKSYTGRNSGPLRVTSSDSNILATTRVLYNKNSYSELMGLPVEQLAKEYLFPYYNNVAMNSQLRVSNVGGADTTITVYLGTTQIDSYSLAAGGSTRKNYTGRNSGPLRVSSSASDILTTIRVLYGTNSYSELMGFPTGQLGQEYWYPVYDNVAVDSQLRVSNVGSDVTTITVYAGTQQIDSYTLNAGGATRKNYTGKNTGPLHVVSSSQPILTTVRTLYAGNSYYEMTGLPNSQLSTQYFFPWYNNKAMDSELRIAIP